jgi:hypothetical protein
VWLSDRGPADEPPYPSLPCMAERQQSLCAQQFPGKEQVSNWARVPACIETPGKEHVLTGWHTVRVQPAGKEQVAVWMRLYERRERGNYNCSSHLGLTRWQGQTTSRVGLCIGGRTDCITRAWFKSAETPCVRTYHRKSERHKVVEPVWARGHQESRTSPNGEDSSLRPHRTDAKPIHPSLPTLHRYASGTGENQGPSVPLPLPSQGGAPGALEQQAFRRPSVNFLCALCGDATKSLMAECHCTPLFLDHCTTKFTQMSFSRAGSTYTEITTP